VAGEFEADDGCRDCDSRFASAMTAAEETVLTDGSAVCISSSCAGCRPPSYSARCPPRWMLSFAPPASCHHLWRHLWRHRPCDCPCDTPHDSNPYCRASHLFRRRKKCSRCLHCGSTHRSTRCQSRGTTSIAAMKLGNYSRPNKNRALLRLALAQLLLALHEGQHGKRLVCIAGKFSTNISNAACPLQAASS